MFPPTDRTWIWLAAGCYLAGVLLGTVALIRGRRHSSAAMYVTLAAGYAFQTFGLYLRGMAVGGCPLGNRFELVQFTAWSAATLYLAVGPAFRLSLLGYATSLLAAGLSLVSLLAGTWDAEQRSNIFGGNAWIELHAALALFSYGVFGLLAAAAAMYWLRDYGLRRKRPDGGFALLPSIRDLDQMGRRLHATGVILLAASLAVGAVWWAREPATVNGPKLAATVSVFTAYALALWLRLTDRLGGRRWAAACLALFAAALLSIAPVSGRKGQGSVIPAEASAP